MSRVAQDPRDVSLVDGVAVAAAGRDDRCRWCRVVFGRKRRDAIFCTKRCRQASWRFGVRRADPLATDRPYTFAYADPPYPGCASYYPENAEVDHASLIDRLTTGFPDGWALSTSSKALRDVLALCPKSARVCAWFKGPRPNKSRSALCSWEPVIVCGGRPFSRESRCMIADGLIAQGRFRAFPGAMIGMKPPDFAVWVFQVLGAAPGDTFHDLFPGSGAVSLAWQRYSGGNP